MRVKLGVFLAILCWSSLFSLSLQDAKKLALKNNLELRSSDYEQKIAKKQYLQAWGEALLQVDLVGGYSYKKTTYPDPSAAFVDGMKQFSTAAAGMSGDDKILADEIAELQDANIPADKQTDFAYGVQATQILSVQTPAMISMAADAAKISKKQYELKKQEVLFTLIKYYYSLLLAQAQYDVQKQALSVAERNFRQVQSKYKNGVVSQYDFLRSKLEVTKQKPALEQAEKDRILARQTFKNYVRWKDKDELVLTDSFVTPLVSLSSLEEAISRSFEKRKEIEIAELATKIKKRDFRMEQLTFLPDLQAGFEYKKFSQTDDNSLGTDNMGDYWQVSLGASMPIFTSGARWNKVAAKQYDWRKAKETELNTRDLVKLDVQNSYYSLVQAKKSWMSQKENLALAKKAFSIAQGRYESGVSTQLEFLDATLQQNVANLGYLNSIYQYIIAFESYKMAIGELL